MSANNLQLASMKTVWSVVDGHTDYPYSIIWMKGKQLFLMNKYKEGECVEVPSGQHDQCPLYKFLFLCKYQIVDISVIAL